MAAVTIGQYRVTGVIGRGGMGAVYAAEHALLGRPAAIKILLPELSKHQDIVMRFFNEARAATAIRHPGIIEIYDFGWTPEGAAYIVMEFLDGETLGRRASRARFRWQNALAIARQIAGALSAAHAKGIVHRDLKPDNVFLVSDPEVPGGERIKLLDFGIAKLAGDSTPHVANVTKTGAVMGTPTYMSPEQCRGVSVDHRADLYALGCIVYELCSGRPPYLGEGSGDVLAAHIHMPVPTLTEQRVTVPAAVEQLLQRLLAKVPAQRVQTADELIGAIDAITTERAAKAVPVSPTASSSTALSGSASTSMRVPRFGMHRGRWSVIAISAAFAAISAAVVMLVMRRDAPAREGEVSAPAVAVAPTAAKLAPPATTERTTPEPRATTPEPRAAEPEPRAAKPEPRAEKQEPPAKPVAAVSPRVDVAIDSVPAGAQVLFDGSVLGKTPFHGTLPRRNGNVTLLLRLAGYADKSVAVRADDAIRERVKLVHQSPPSPPPPPRPRPNRDDSVNPFAK